MALKLKLLLSYCRFLLKELFKIFKIVLQSYNKHFNILNNGTAFNRKGRYSEMNYICNLTIELNANRYSYSCS